jgi:multidrug resistance efflux pump
MRYSRLLVGFALIFLALWIIVGEQMSGASANAVVNAPLSTLRAPVAGQITVQDRSLGSAVSRLEELASVIDPLVDTIRLNDLTMEEAFATAEVARVTARLAALDLQIEELAARRDAFQAARIAEITTRLSYARERLRLLESGATEVGAPTDLPDEGQSGDQDDPPAVGIALYLARESVEVLEIALRSAEAGVFLGDGFNDAPYAEQRRAELATEQNNLTAELAREKARLAAVAARVVQERLRTGLLGNAALQSTVTGQVWEVLAADGETVQRGQDVLRLVDCDRAIVTLSVSENVYNRLKIGDDAVFRMSGDGRNFGGSIIRMAGSGAATIYENLAVAPSQRHLERYDVALLVPALRDEPDLRCSIGRTGRAFFENRPLDWLRGIWN